MIEKHSTVLDNAVLLAATAWNLLHKEKSTFVLFGNTEADDHILSPNKTPRIHSVEQRRDEVAAAFGYAFGGDVDG